MQRPAAILALLLCANLLNFFDRTLLGGLAEPIRHDFHLADTALGLLTTVFTLSYAVLGLPVGRLADRLARPRLMSAGVALWSLFTLTGGFATSFALLFAARIGVGVGETTCAPCAQSLIADLYPRAQRARAMAIFMLGLPLGVICSFLVGAELAPRFGWRATLMIAALPGFAVAGLLLRVREPGRGALEATAAPGDERPSLRGVLRTPTLWWIVLSGALQNFSLYALNSFQTSFLQRWHGMTLREANLASALVLGATGVVGLLAGGWGGDWLAARHVRGRLLLPAVAMVLAAPCFALAYAQPRGAIGPLLLLTAAAVTLVQTYYSTVYATLQEVVNPRLRGTAVAIYFFAMYLLGGSAGPLVTGALSDHFARAAMRASGATTLSEAHRAAGLHDAMYLIPVLVLACGVVLLAASGSLPADVARLRVRTGAPAAAPAA